MRARRSVGEGESAHPQSAVKRIGLIGTAAIVLICIAAALDIQTS